MDEHHKHLYIYIIAFDMSESFDNSASDWLRNSDYLADVKKAIIKNTKGDSVTWECYFKKELKTGADFEAFINKFKVLVIIILPFISVMPNTDSTSNTASHEIKDFPGVVNPRITPKVAAAFDVSKSYFTLDMYHEQQREMKELRDIIIKAGLPLPSK